MTATATRSPQPGKLPRPNPIKRYVLWPARNLWRSLTSMRTALALLFLLALAAVPGALLPQRSLNETKTEQYIADHGFVGELFDKIGMYEVFSSIWFTAIYALLFISLVGCLTPRMIEHAKSLRARPVPAPRNLARLPRHESHEIDGTPDEIAAKINGGLRGWRKTTRTVERKQADGTVVTVVEVSAEKGYLREFGNLVFHFALLALLVSIAAGKMFGYEGTRILVADGQEGLCNTSTAVYDSFRAGNLVDGTNLNEFCMQIDSFDADFLPSGQPDMYSAKIRYQVGEDIDNDEWQESDVQVNHPLRIAGDRIYLLGNGFAPTFTVTFPNGETRTQTVPFQPNELQTMMSSGAARFDTPAGLYPNEDERRKHQIALEGLFAPTAVFHGGLMTSSFPLPENPAVAIDVYQGDTGLDTGRPQNVFSLDVNLINQGRLLKKERVNLQQGEQTRLEDGTTVQFDGYQRWVSLQVSHDPAQNWVLVSAIAMLAGLLVSLLIKRRRVWARITPLTESRSGDAAPRAPTSAEEPASQSQVDPSTLDVRRSVVEMAGLARTDQAGWGEGFPDMVADLLGLERTKTPSGK
ncbi:cytochrome C biogenesis protein ResB [Williamsia sp. 1138]|uniref:cytochrome c biogenesis protein ResB n=1 Tax=Williamsia sp. 1138 TaxID=1903117 RepID=UPI000A111DB4|nr:cytochrome c biogenesis protein ResB [Williamsia sp. 1138]OZG28196.1 cytochrome C biogenesis protein ResB [Williamsia sp. 1138]